MKKGLLIILCIFLLVGCTNQKEENKVDIIENTTVIDEPVETYKDDNPIKVGLYIDGKLLNELNKEFIDSQDLAVFDVYFTDEENVGTGSTKYLFNKYYNNYENIDNYKIGFEVSFDADNKHYEKVVLDPDVEFALSPYVYIYLYDDIHQADGSWYSHVTKDDYKDNTIFSSIKLYISGWSYQISTPITLKVFTYDGEEDFDEEGHYRGDSSHTVVINNK